jgi:hypothetical protein
MLGAGSALGQVENFGKQGTIGLSADRLFGFYSAHRSNDSDFFQDDDDWTGFGIGWGAPHYPYNIPRFAFDYFVIDSLSIGGALGYFSINDNDDGFSDQDITAFILSPRVGYWIGFGAVAGFWPRGGFTYHSLSIDGGYDESGFGLTLEGMFGIGPVEHFMFLVGPTIDFDFIGERDNCPGPGGDEDCSWKYRSIGIQVGLMGWI